MIAVRLEVGRCRSELDNVRTTVLVFHASSYSSHTYDMSNLVDHEMLVAFFCATNTE